MTRNNFGFRELAVGAIAYVCRCLCTYDGCYAFRGWRYCQGAGTTGMEGIVNVGMEELCSVAY